MRLEKDKTRINLIFLVITLLISSTFSFGAVVSHAPAQVTPGTFAAGNYIFPDNLSVTDSIGIGTSNPSEKLDVAGNIQISNGAYINTPTISEYSIYIGDTSNTTQYGNLWIKGSLDGSHGLRVYPRDEAGSITTYAHLGYDGTNDRLEMGTASSTDSLMIDTSGNVGIGVDPSYNLDVSGTGRFTGALTSATLDTGQGANELYDMNQNVQTTDSVDFNDIDLGSTEVALTFDNGADMITVHDGYGNFNIKSGLDENNLITNTAGGSHISLAEAGGITLYIDESTSIGGTFSASSGISINGGTTTVTGTLDAPTLNTGQGDNELYDMDQNLKTTDSPTFNQLDINVGGSANSAIELRRAGSLKWTLWNRGTDDRFFVSDADASAYAYMVQNSGSWYAGSDIRLKSNITYPKNVLDRIENITLIRYLFKNNTNYELGLIAQDVIKEFPEIVSNTSDGYLGLGYDRTGPIAIQAIKELRAEKDQEIRLLEEEMINSKLENIEMKQAICKINQTFEFCNT